jgi:hypothetical protein
MYLKPEIIVNFVFFFKIQLHSLLGYYTVLTTFAPQILSPIYTQPAIEVIKKFNSNSLESYCMI